MNPDPDDDFENDPERTPLDEPDSEEWDDSDPDAVIPYHLAARQN